MIKLLLKGILGLLILMGGTMSADATIINFDDLEQASVPDGYAGLTWGSSILSRPSADSTSFYVNADQSYATPHSSPNYVLNGYGVPDLWFEFPSAVNFKGAWFATAQNNAQNDPQINKLAAQRVRLVDDLGQTSAWLELTEAPQYLAADFPNSKRIYVQPAGVYDGNASLGGWYTMDDISYEPVSTPVTHSFTLSLTGTGSGAVNSAPSGPIACSYSPQTGTCTFTAPHNSSITLTETTGSGSQFLGWSGDCSSCAGPACEIILDSDQPCSAKFDILPLVRSAGPALYASLTAAYAQLSEGASAALEVQGVTLSEMVTLDRDVAVIVRGGYDAAFASRSGYSTIQGSLIVRQGSLKADRLAVR